MKRIVLLLTALAILTSGSLLASQAVSAQQTVPSPDETIVVVGQMTKSKFIDLRREGESVGDVLLNRSILLDEAGVQVGRLATRCVLHFKPHLLCDGVYEFTGRGKITFTNLPDTSQEPPLIGPITGGDGDFANITGQFVIDFTEQGNVTTFEIHRAE